MIPKQLSKVQCTCAGCSRHSLSVYATRHFFIQYFFNPLMINLREDTQAMPQSRSATFPKHQQMERLGTNNGKTNAIFEITKTRRKNKCNTGIAFIGANGRRKTSLGWWWESLNQFDSTKSSRLVLAFEKHRF